MVALDFDKIYQLLKNVEMNNNEEVKIEEGSSNFGSGGSMKL